MGCLSSQGHFGQRIDILLELNINSFPPFTHTTLISVTIAMVLPTGNWLLCSLTRHFPKCLIIVSLPRHQLEFISIIIPTTRNLSFSKQILDRKFYTKVLQYFTFWKTKSPFKAFNRIASIFFRPQIGCWRDRFTFDTIVVWRCFRARFWREKRKMNEAWKKIDAICGGIWQRHCENWTIIYTPITHPIENWTEKTLIVSYCETQNVA